MAKQIVITFPNGQPSVSIEDSPEEYISPREVSLAKRAMDVTYNRHRIESRRRQFRQDQLSKPKPVSLAEKLKSVTPVKS